MMLRENKKRINYFFDWKSNKKYFNNNSIRRITSKLNARIFSKFYVTLSYFLLWISASDTQKLFVSHGNEIDVREEKTKTVFRFLGILTIYKIWASIYLAQTHIVVFLRSAFYVFVRVLWICELRENIFLFFFDKRPIKVKKKKNKKRRLKFHDSTFLFIFRVFVVFNQIIFHGRHFLLLFPSDIPTRKNLLFFVLLWQVFSCIVFDIRNNKKEWIFSLRPVCHLLSLLNSIQAKKFFAIFLRK